MKELPKDIALERSVIGAITMEPELYNEVADILTPETFTDPVCASVIDFINLSDTKGTEWDLLSIASLLSAKNGNSKTEAYMQICETHKNIQSYSSIKAHSLHLKALLIRREFYKRFGRLATHALDEGIDIFDTLDNANKTLSEVEGNIQANTTKSIKEIIPKSIEQIEKAGENLTGISGLPTMIAAIDRPLSGLKAGKLIVIGARPGMGKTAFCLSAMLNLSTYQDIPSLFISLEMPENEIVNRFLCNHCEIDNELLKTGLLSDDDWTRLNGDLQPLIDSKIFIDDQAGINMIQLKSKIRQAVIKHKVKAVFIDYLQLLKLDGQNRDQAIGEATRSLKHIAKEYGIPIVLLCQLSRQCEQRPDKRPMLSDLRESGNIEQDADAVGFLYRDSYYNKENPTDINGTQVEPEFSELIWSKNRDGETGISELKFEGKYFRFSNYTQSPGMRYTKVDF